MVRNRKNLCNDNVTDPTLFNRVISTNGIFQELRGFLDENTNNVKPEIKHFYAKNSDMNNLMNVSRVFREIKKAEFYWQLSRKHSVEYFRNVFYKSILDSLFTNTQRQVSIDLSHFSLIRDEGDLSNVSALGNVHTLKLCGSRKLCNVSSLGNIHSLDLSFCPLISDVRMLGNMHTIHLEDCENLTYFRALGGVQKLP